MLKCRVKDHHELQTVVGLMPAVSVGSVLTLEGSWKHDGTYGPQFSVHTYEETLPATAYGIEKYLGSGLIKGIGPVFARKIVTAFGTGTLEIIESEISRLREIRESGMSGSNGYKEAGRNRRKSGTSCSFSRAME